MSILYQDSQCTIELHQAIIRFSGKLEQLDYRPLEKALQEIDRQISAHEITLDLTPLHFLNSRGIRMLANFITGSAKKFQIQTNSELSWQQKTIPMLAYLRPERIKITA